MGTPTTSYYAFCGLINGISCFALSIFVLVKGPREPRNRLYSSFAFFVAGYNFLYFFWAISPSAEIALKWFVGIMFFVIPVGGVFMHLAAEMTNQTKSRAVILIISYALTVFFMIANHRLWLYTELVPRYQFGWWPRITPLCYLFHIFWFWQVIVSHGWLFLGLHRVHGQEREQLKFMIVGTLVGYAGAFTNWFLWYNIPIPPYLNILITPFQMIIAYSIVRHGLLSKEAIKKSLVYSALIAIITAAYLVMVLIMERSFAGFFGYRSLVATAVVAGLIALGFNPLRDRLQGLIDRALFTGTPPELAAQREQLLLEVRKGEQLKAVATLAAGLAHEIKNPLAAVKTFTEHLSTHYDDPAFRAKFQTIVGGEVERINRIVQQLLEFAKPVPPKLAPVQLTSLLDQTLDFLGQDCLARRIELRRDYQSPGSILGDASQLKQVFLNLFLNSLEAMNGHGGRLTVSTRQDGAELLLTISDTGAGIAPEHLAHLGEPFYTTKAQGTGLGLAVVQGILKEHGGRFTLTSQVGRGTIAEIRLPIAVRTG